MSACIGTWCVDKEHSVETCLAAGGVFAYEIDREGKPSLDVVVPVGVVLPGDRAGDGDCPVGNSVRVGGELGDRSGGDGLVGWL